MYLANVHDMRENLTHWPRRCFSIAVRASSDAGVLIAGAFNCGQESDQFATAKHHMQLNASFDVPPVTVIKMFYDLCHNISWFGLSFIAHMSMSLGHLTPFFLVHGLSLLEPLLILCTAAKVA